MFMLKGFFPPPSAEKLGYFSTSVLINHCVIPPINLVNNSLCLMSAKGWGIKMEG